MPTVAEFLIERMSNAGIKQVFGVPGDYVLNFYKQLNDSQLQMVNCTDETHAGFAANTYARLNGAGAVCVTYNVGALKIANAVAGAYAERCPVVVISGSPGIKERQEDMLLHHMVRSFECQKQVFDNLTCYSVVLDDPMTAGYKIDAAFEALHHHKQPVYIELPRDIADRQISYDAYQQGTPAAPKSDPENLAEALAEVEEWIKSSKNPVILAGVQLARYSLGAEMLKWAEKCNIPIATTLLAKSIINEKHPLFAGTYSGNASEPDVRKLVEESDCLLMFGVLLTDMTLTFKPARFKKRNVVNCAVEGLSIKNHTFTKIQFQDFCKSVFKLELPKKEPQCIGSKLPVAPFVAKEAKITSARFFEQVNSMLSEKFSIIADVGDSLFGAADLRMHHKSSFVASAFYTSMGTAIPGALGMCFAQPDKRPIVLVGDGAFQMSCTELSTILRYGFNPIVFVLNNGGYTTERYLLDGNFNDIDDWSYHRIIDVFGKGNGALVKTEQELQEAVVRAIASDQMSIINVMLDKMDISPALKRTTEGLAKRV